MVTTGSCVQSDCSFHSNILGFSISRLAVGSGGGKIENWRRSLSSSAFHSCLVVSRSNPRRKFICFFFFSFLSVLATMLHLIPKLSPENFKKSSFHKNTMLQVQPVNRQRQSCKDMVSLDLLYYKTLFGSDLWTRRNEKRKKSSTSSKRYIRGGCMQKYVF